MVGLWWNLLCWSCCSSLFRMIFWTASPDFTKKIIENHGLIREGNLKSEGHYESNRIIKDLPTIVFFTNIRFVRWIGLQLVCPPPCSFSIPKSTKKSSLMELLFYFIPLGLLIIFPTVPIFRCDIVKWCFLKSLGNSISPTWKMLVMKSICWGFVEGEGDTQTHLPLGGSSQLGSVVNNHNACKSPKYRSKFPLPNGLLSTYSL